MRHTTTPSATSHFTCRMALTLSRTVESVRITRFPYHRFQLLQLRPHHRSRRLHHHNPLRHRLARAHGCVKRSTPASARRLLRRRPIGAKMRVGGKGKPKLHHISKRARYFNHPQHRPAHRRRPVHPLLPVHPRRLHPLEYHQVPLHPHLHHRHRFHGRSNASPPLD